MHLYYEQCFAFKVTKISLGRYLKWPVIKALNLFPV